ncbi:hypothetical protein Y032_0110g139 [Ancylostoma ceylanicum]|uniref:Uncharacterized protein n=1 Tax=Ancylostoma ceylanicum TaxID=53326 RepID=A0A016TDS6_9BILA|nr:hypothetical protein Y032_0110g139 [Ancylostoma ceylanicum]
MRSSLSDSQLVRVAGGKLVRAVDASETAAFPVFGGLSRCFIIAYEFIAPDNLNIQRNLEHENFYECCL